MPTFSVCPFLLFYNVGTYSLLKHIDYLEKERNLAPNSILAYRKASSRLGIDEIDFDALPKLWSKLYDNLPDMTEDGVVTKEGLWGYVTIIRGPIWSLLKMMDIEPKGLEFHMLEEKIAKLKDIKGIPKGYTEAQIKLLLRESRFAGYRYGLFRLLIFLTYTGCRISAAAGIDPYKDFREIPEVPGVLAVRVTSKRHTYDAIIAKHAYEEILRWNPASSPTLSGHREGTMKSSFSDYNRALLEYVISSKSLGKDLSVDTSIFHSIRKFFSNKLTEDEVPFDDISLLLGQKPNSLAFKAYISAGGKTMEKITVRCAKAYARTSFMTWQAWDSTSLGAKK